MAPFKPDDHTKAFFDNFIIRDTEGTLYFSTLRVAYSTYCKIHEITPLKFSILRKQLEIYFQTGKSGIELIGSDCAKKLYWTVRIDLPDMT